MCWTESKQHVGLVWDDDGRGQHMVEFSFRLFFGLDVRLCDKSLNSAGVKIYRSCLKCNKFRSTIVFLFFYDDPKLCHRGGRAIVRGRGDGCGRGGGTCWTGYRSRGGENLEEVVVPGIAIVTVAVEVAGCQTNYRSR